MQIYDLSASMHVYSSGCNSHYQGLTNASGKKNYSSFSCRHNSIYIHIDKAVRDQHFFRVTQTDLIVHDANT